MSSSIYIASSQWFTVIALLLYIAMAVSTWLSALSWLLTLPLTIIMAWDCWHVIKLYGLRQHKNSVTILCQDCDKWQYQLKSGRTYKGGLIKERSFTSRWVIILYMQHINRYRYIVIPRDSLSKRNYRLLAYKLNS